MLYSNTLFSYFLAVFLCLMLFGTNPVRAQTVRPEFVPGELLLKLKDGTSQRRVLSILAEVDGSILRKHQLISTLHVRIPRSSVKAAVELLRHIPEVEYVEPNYLRYQDLIPNDEHFEELWGLDNIAQTGGFPDADIDAPEAWDITTGNVDVVVAVIDSGIDLTHPDLNVWTNPGEIPNNGIDDDQNGFVDDVHGWDFAGNDNDPTDRARVCSSHGTHTAGTIGAIGNNGIGVTGINWDVTIMPLRAFKKRFLIFCSGADSDIIDAIQYAADKGVRISNNSYGGGPRSRAVLEAIRASKSVFVAAAGNESNDNDNTPHFPSGYDLDNIISVAATDDNDLIASFSNFGTNTVDLGAPGVNILSTIRPGKYGFLSGTSMAAPHAAGAAALLLASDPTLTNNEIVWRIVNSTDVVGLPVLSGGRLNISNALNITPVVTISITPLGPTKVSAGGKIKYSVYLANTGSSTSLVEASIVGVFPDGQEVVLQERTLMLPARESGSERFSLRVPESLPAGNYQLAVRAEVVAESFDEEIVTYRVE